MRAIQFSSERFGVYGSIYTCDIWRFGIKGDGSYRRIGIGYIRITLFVRAWSDLNDE
jgi:hypothetical protein